MSASCRNARLLRHDSLASGVYCSAEAFAWGGFRKQLPADVSCMPRSATAHRLPQTLSISHRECRKSGPNSERGSTENSSLPGRSTLDKRKQQPPGNHRPQALELLLGAPVRAAPLACCYDGSLYSRPLTARKKRKLSRRRCVRCGTDRKIHPCSVS